MTKLEKARAVQNGAEKLLDSYAPGTDARVHASRFLNATLSLSNASLARLYDIVTEKDICSNCGRDYRGDPLSPTEQCICITGEDA